MYIDMKLRLVYSVTFDESQLDWMKIGQNVLFDQLSQTKYDPILRDDDFVERTENNKNPIGTSS